MKGELLEAVVEARAARKPVVRLVWLDGGREALVDPAVADDDVEAELLEAANEALRADKASLVETG